MAEGRKIKMLTIKKTLEVLSEGSDKSKRGKYWVDAAEYSFFWHTLNLLSKIAKKEIEEEQLPQEAGLQRFDCTECRGAGYTEEWGEWDDYKQRESKIIRDCPNCKGEGFIMIEVVDKREKTKDNPLYYNNEC